MITKQQLIQAVPYIEGAGGLIICLMTILQMVGMIILAITGYSEVIRGILIGGLVGCNAGICILLGGCLCRKKYIARIVDTEENVQEQCPVPTVPAVEGIQKVLKQEEGGEKVENTLRNTVENMTAQDSADSKKRVRI